MIEDYASDSITVAPYVATDQNGVDSFGTPVPTEARFQYSSGVFTNSDGEKELSDAVCMIDLSVTCGIKSKIGYDGAFFSVVRHSTHRNLSGDGFHKTILQRVVA